MLKFLIFLSLLVSAPFFLTEASSLDVEFQPESDRIIDSFGWLEPGKLSFQEQVQIIIDHSESKNRIAVGMMSKSPNDIRFPDYIEDIVSDPRIISFSITNQFACAPTQTDRACIIIDVEREGLGDTIPEIRDNTRKITDPLTERGVMHYSPEFNSVTLQPKNTPDGEKVFVARALYTINKQSTSAMFGGLTSTLLNADIRTAGGFYTHAEELAKNTFSDFTVSFVTMDGEGLRTVNVSLICSDVIRELMRCPDNVTEQITNGEINPLEFIQIENINRSALFTDEFLPLNSVIHISIFSKEDIQVKSVNTNLLEKLNISTVQDNGWFFTKSDQKIDGRYLFGSDSSVSKNDLIFSIGPNSGSPIEVKEGGSNNDIGGGCLIATAAFGSELAPQVQFLREIRDNTVLQTESGTSFMTGFNQFYYSFSPAIADYERENPVFKEAVKVTLTPLLTSLTLLQYADIDSESEMLGYGIGIILLNIGMYFVAPAVLIMKVRKQI